MRITSSPAFRRARRRCDLDYSSVLTALSVVVRNDHATELDASALVDPVLLQLEVEGLPVDAQELARL
jgi:hypothetical protein